MLYNTGTPRLRKFAKELKVVGMVDAVEGEVVGAVMEATKVTRGEVTCSTWNSRRDIALVPGRVRLCKLENIENNFLRCNLRA